MIGAVLPGHPGNWLEHWFEGLIKTPAAAGVDHATLYGPGVEWALMGISVSLASLSVIAAIYLYIIRPELPAQIVARMRGLHHLVYNKYFVDEFYFGKIINPLISASRSLWAHVDVNFIDRTTYVVSDMVRGMGSAARTFQNGNMQQYAMYIAIAVAATIFLVLR